MSAFVIEDEQLVQELLKRARQEGRSVEAFLRLVVDVWPDAETPQLTEHDTLSDEAIAALLTPSEQPYPTLAEVIEQGLAGGLEHRTDIGDSVEYILQLRRKLWERQQ